MNGLRMAVDALSFERLSSLQSLFKTGHIL